MGKFSDCGGRTFPLVWHCIATVMGELSHRSGKVLPPQWQNFATNFGI
ncbi:MAG: hypothetical protein IJT97_01825 [Bacteroidaceae bacterium]|nr:hypothetical protein [Bacteroidaceae bacterium]